MLIQVGVESFLNMWILLFMGLGFKIFITLLSFIGMTLVMLIHIFVVFRSVGYIGGSIIQIVRQDDMLNKVCFVFAIVFSLCVLNMTSTTFNQTFTLFIEFLSQTWRG
ncbi:MAG: hypothetical protein ACRCX2_14730 [Paraclostridium sp.]